MTAHTLTVAVAVSLMASLTLLPARGADVPRPPDMPGVPIAHSPKSTRIYLSTPGIVALPDGTYLAKCDEFGPGSSDVKEKSATTLVFRSRDRGQSWEKIATLRPLFWSNLFLHRGALYQIGVTSSHNGAIVAYRSDDGGVTWTQPKDESTGLIRTGKFHTSSMPVVYHAGRIWRAMETFDPKIEKNWYAVLPLMMSAPEDADLLQASSWTITEPARRPTTQEVGFDWRTWLEGNPVLGPDGKMMLMMRADYRGEGKEYAALLEVSEDGKTLHFDPKTCFIEFPGGCKKFNVRFDPQTRMYFAISNYVPQRYWKHNSERARNTAVLMCSPDLKRWEARAALLHHPDIEKHGFHYADWQFEGDDLIAVFRTAFEDGMGGAHNQHNSNFLMFKRIANFRSLTPDDSVEPWLADDLKQWNAAHAADQAAADQAAAGGE